MIVSRDPSNGKGIARFPALADADIAATAVKVRFTNAGRFIVEESVADEFVAAFTEDVRALKVGDPAERATEIGPLARANQSEFELGGHGIREFVNTKTLWNGPAR
jgi:hypothetical protein